ncbi:hypothetical protein Rsub_07378 [Raphidocelis subcapitata]|uniref:Uncharacterized protein n=1 Tax=Raphidocelis subcapitata TaxID=307507 RepID=A0A2V0P6T9_9CHLO|nr:hypothetical protein Rsub_07378 [Raphidocelis subcapitata]|eukprot:GBF94642.1 hypothetical protein Rsub_07378 [Raphidocelis subcapitata]
MSALGRLLTLRASASAAAHRAMASAAAPPAPAAGAWQVRAALVRGLPASFSKALQMHAGGPAIDAAAAAREHEAYTALLERLVPRVVELPADEAHPDCVFIEDTAIVTPCGVAVVTRPGAPERRGEVGPVAAALERLREEGAGAAAGESAAGGAPLVRAVHRLEPPALLDGGDVLQVAGFVLIGLSARTNAAAVEQVRAALARAGARGPDGAPLRVEGVPMPHGLHLKSACSALDDSTLLASDDAAGRAVVDGLRSAVPALAARLAVEFVPSDPLAANVLRIGGAVVMQASPAEGFVRALCDARGLRLHALPRAAELAKADAALTCCSILLA